MEVFGMGEDRHSSRIDDSSFSFDYLRDAGASNGVTQRRGPNQTVDTNDSVSFLLDASIIAGTTPGLADTSSNNMSADAETAAPPSVASTAASNPSATPRFRKKPIYSLDDTSVSQFLTASPSTRRSPQNPKANSTSSDRISKAASFTTTAAAAASAKNSRNFLDHNRRFQSKLPPRRVSTGAAPSSPSPSRSLSSPMATVEVITAVPTTAAASAGTNSTKSPVTRKSPLRPPQPLSTSFSSGGGVQKNTTKTLFSPSSFQRTPQTPGGLWTVNTESKSFVNGLLSPFSPLLRSPRNGSKTNLPTIRSFDDDENENENEKNVNINPADSEAQEQDFFSYQRKQYLQFASLQPCRKVSIVVRVTAIDDDDDDNKRCIFPHNTDPPAKARNESPEVSSAFATPNRLTSDKATPIKSSRHVRDMVVVNPTAFGKFVPSKDTMETAKLVAQVANIPSEDWARLYEFHHVIWPSTSRPSPDRKDIHNTPNSAHSNTSSSSSYNTLDSVTRAVVQDLMNQHKSSLLISLGHENSCFGTLNNASKNTNANANANDNIGLWTKIINQCSAMLETKGVVRLSMVELIEPNIGGRNHSHRGDYFRDLLAPPDQKSTSISLRHEDMKGAKLEGLCTVEIDSMPALLEALSTGRHESRNRRNSDDGASATIIGTLSYWENAVAYKMEKKPCSTVTCVEMASPNHNKGTIESISHRKSIVSLGQALRQLLLQQAMEKHAAEHTSEVAPVISYRETTLTKVLQRYMESSKIVLIASVSPLSKDYHQTVTTLNYLRRLLVKPGTPLTSPFGGGKENPNTSRGGITTPKTAKMSNRTNGDRSRPNLLSPEVLSPEIKETMIESLVADPRQRLAKTFQVGTPSPSRTAKKTLDESLAAATIVEHEELLEKALEEDDKLMEDLVTDPRQRLARSFPQGTPSPSRSAAAMNSYVSASAIDNSTVASDHSATQPNNYTGPPEEIRQVNHYPNKDEYQGHRQPLWQQKDHGDDDDKHSNSGVYDGNGSDPYEEVYPADGHVNSNKDYTYHNDQDLSKEWASEEEIKRDLLRNARHSGQYSPVEINEVLGTQFSNQEKDIVTKSYEAEESRTAHQIESDTYDLASNESENHVEYVGEIEMPSEHHGKNVRREAALQSQIIGEENENNQHTSTEYYALIETEGGTEGNDFFLEDEEKQDTENVGIKSSLHENEDEQEQEQDTVGDEYELELEERPVGEYGFCEEKITRGLATLPLDQSNTKPNHLDQEFVTNGDGNGLNVDEDDDITLDLKPLECDDDSFSRFTADKWQDGMDEEANNRERSEPSNVLGVSTAENDAADSRKVETVSSSFWDLNPENAEDSMDGEAKQTEYDLPDDPFTSNQLEGLFQHQISQSSQNHSPTSSGGEKPLSSHRRESACISFTSPYSVTSRSKEQEELIVERDQLRSVVETLKDDLQKASVKNENCVQQHEEQLQDLYLQLRKAHDTNKELASTQQELQNLALEREEMEHTIESLQCQLSELSENRSRESQRNEKDIAVFHSKLSEEREKQQVLKAIAEEAVTARDTQIEEIKMLAAKREGLQGEIETLRNTMKTMDKEQDDHATKYQQEILQLYTKLEEVTNEKRSLQQAADDARFRLETQSEKMRAMNLEREELRSTLSSVKGSAKKAYGDHSEYTRRFREEIQQLHEKLDDAIRDKLEVAKSADEIRFAKDDLERKVKNLENDLSVSQTNSLRLEDMIKGEVETIRELNAELHKRDSDNIDLEHFRSEAQRLKSKNDHLESLISHKNIEYSAALQKLEDDLTEEKSRNLKLEEELSLVKTELSSCKKQKRELEENLGSLSDNKSKLIHELNKKHEVLENLQSRYNDLESLQFTNQGVIANLREELQKQESESVTCGQLRAQMSSIERERDSLRELMETQRAEHEKSMAERESELSTYLGQLYSAKEDIRKSKNSEERYRTDAKTQLRLLRESESSVRHRDGKIERLQNELETQKKEMMSLRDLESSKSRSDQEIEHLKQNLCNIEIALKKTSNEKEDALEKLKKESHSRKLVLDELEIARDEAHRYKLEFVNLKENSDRRHQDDQRVEDIISKMESTLKAFKEAKEELGSSAFHRKDSASVLQERTLQENNRDLTNNLHHLNEMVEKLRRERDICLQNIHDGEEKLSKLSSKKAKHLPDDMFSTPANEHRRRYRESRSTPQPMKTPMPVIIPEIYVTKYHIGPSSRAEERAEEIAACLAISAKKAMEENFDEVSQLRSQIHRLEDERSEQVSALRTRVRDLQQELSYEKVLNPPTSVMGSQSSTTQMRKEHHSFNGDEEKYSF